MEKEKEYIYVGIVLDTETGGLDNQKNGVLQVSMHALRFDTLEIFNQLNFYIRPYDKPAKQTKRKVLKTKFEKEEEEKPILMEYTESAEKIHRITLDFARDNGVSPKEAGEKICQFVKDSTITKSKIAKPILIGQNIPFDIGFIQQLGEIGGWYEDFAKLMRSHKDYFGNYQIDYMDTLDIAHLALGHRTDITSYKLEIIAKTLGIELDDAHDADADVTATEEIARNLAVRMRNGNGTGDFTLTETKKMKTREHFKI